MDCVGLDLQYWDAVKDGLQESLDIDNNKFSLDDIHLALIKKDMQLWCIHDGIINVVFVTAIVNYPQKKVLECIALNGENPQLWIQYLLQCMESFAIQNQCNLIATGGRKGWEKMFKQNGWTSTHIKLSKGIDYAK